MAREEDAEEGELGEIVPAPRRAAGGGHERGRGRSRSPSRDERKRKRPSSRDARRDDSRRGDDGRDGAGRDRDRRGWGADRDRDREWDRGKRRDWGDRPASASASARTPLAARVRTERSATPPR
jgi:hypothetical protein